MTNDHLQPQAFRQIRVDSFNCLLKYSRRDLRSKMEQVIDSVRPPVQSLLTGANYFGILEDKENEDGDIDFVFESGAFHFQLSVGARVTGVQFRNLIDQPTAVAISKTFMTEVVGALGLQDLHAMSVEFRNIFYLQLPADKLNFELFVDRLMPSVREPGGTVSNLIGNIREISRLDFKVGWHLDETVTAYLTMEFPGNERQTTFWPSLYVRSREDVPLSADLDTLTHTIDRTCELYEGGYAEIVCRLLEGVPLDQARKPMMVPTPR